MDSKSLLAIIDALSIRYAGAELESEKTHIFALQQALFSAGITAHKKHRIVRKSLTEKRAAHKQMHDKQEIYRLSDPEDHTEENLFEIVSNADAINKLLRDLEEILQCSITFELMKNPVILEDGHT